MGLRDRIREALRPVVRRVPLLGEALSPPADGPPGPGESPVPDPPPPKKTDSAWRAEPTAAPAAAEAPEPTASAPEPTEADKVAEQKAKQEKHLAKARRGVLARLDELGGSAPMKELHDYSERRFFIAHRGFSNMMEFFVDEGLVEFDHDAGNCTLTDAGRAFEG